MTMSWQLEFCTEPRIVTPQTASTVSASVTIFYVDVCIQCSAQLTNSKHRVTNAMDPFMHQSSASCPCAIAASAAAREMAHAIAGTVIVVDSGGHNVASLAKRKRRDRCPPVRFLCGGGSQQYQTLPCCFWRLLYLAWLPIQMGRRDWTPTIGSTHNPQLPCSNLNAHCGALTSSPATVDRERPGARSGRSAASTTRCCGAATPRGRARSTIRPTTS
jgi:hypothetical protein